MTRLLLLCLLSLITAPALAIYKCESANGITYSDAPCPGGKSLALNDDNAPSTDASQAKQRAIREKQELKQLENARHKREASEEKEQKRMVKVASAKQKKCAALTQQRKWSEEDAANASLKSSEKAKRKARRVAEKYERECGKS